MRTGTVLALGILIVVATWATYRFTGERGRTSFTTSREQAMAAAAGNADQDRPDTRTAPAPRVVAVLPFTNADREADSASLSTALGDLVGAALQSEGTIQVLPGERVSRMAADLALAEAGSYTRETLDRIRAQIGCDVVIGGSHTGSDGILRVDARAQDVATGATLGVVSETGSRGDPAGLAARVGAGLRQTIGR